MFLAMCQPSCQVKTNWMSKRLVGLQKNDIETFESFSMETDLENRPCHIDIAVYLRNHRFPWTVAFRKAMQNHINRCETAPRWSWSFTARPPGWKWVPQRLHGTSFCHLTKGIRHQTMCWICATKDVILKAQLMFNLMVINIRIPLIKHILCSN